MLDIRLYGIHSLKDKRRVVQSLLSRLRDRFGLACAEVGENDIWARTLIGMACVSNQGWHAEEILRSAISWVEENIDGEILSSEISVII